MRSRRHLLVIVLSVILGVQALLAQDDEPRRWSPVALDAKVVGAAYAFSWGNVFFNPATELEDVDVEVHSLTLNYIQPFRIGKRFGRIGILVPFNHQRWNGLLSGVPREVDRTGLVDPRIRVSFNLIGAPAANLDELVEYYKENPKGFTLGVGLAVRIPLGQYDPNKAINIGTNRFVIRPQVGFEYRWGLWSYELSSSLFFFTVNNEFLGQRRRAQNAIFATQTHLIKRFEKGFWASLDAGYGYGGDNFVNGVPLRDYKSNLIGGGTIGFRYAGNQTGKFFYFRQAALTDFGQDLNVFGLVWTMLIK